MALLAVKTRNLISAACPRANLIFRLKNIKINGVYRGCSGFVVNKDNDRVIYLNTENSAMNLGFMYRFADSITDYSSLKYRNRFAKSVPEFVRGISECLTGELPFGKED